MIFLENDNYDEIFGEPTTEVVKIEGVLEFLDSVIAYSQEITELEEGVNDKYDLQVDRVVMTSLFEKAVKLLTKKKKTNTLKELKGVILRLGNYEISTDKKNHPLKNAQGHLDLHLDGGNLILLYKYFNEEVFEIDVDEKSLLRCLRLQDVVDHKQLKNYDNKKYNNNTKEADLDKLFKD